jgi:hypothetical protein
LSKEAGLPACERSVRWLRRFSLLWGAVLAQ